MKFESSVFTKIEGSIPGFKFAGSNIGAIISALIPIIFFIAGALLLVFITLGGISLMTAAGDPKKTAGAKEQITNGIIGFFVVFTAFWIVQILAIALGLPSVLSIFGR